MRSLAILPEGDRHLTALAAYAASRHPSDLLTHSKLASLLSLTNIGDATGIGFEPLHWFFLIVDRADQIGSSVISTGDPERALAETWQVERAAQSIDADTAPLVASLAKLRGPRTSLTAMQFGSFSDTEKQGVASNLLRHAETVLSMSSEKYAARWRLVAHESAALSLEVMKDYEGAAEQLRRWEAIRNRYNNRYSPLETDLLLVRFWNNLAVDTNDVKWAAMAQERVSRSDFEKKLEAEPLDYLDSYARYVSAFAQWQYGRLTGRTEVLEAARSAALRAAESAESRKLDGILKKAEEVLRVVEAELAKRLTGEYIPNGSE
jgi:hypothetical protein